MTRVGEARSETPQPPRVSLHMLPCLRAQCCSWEDPEGVVTDAVDCPAERIAVSVTTLSS